MVALNFVSLDLKSYFTYTNEELQKFTKLKSQKCLKSNPWKQRNGYFNSVVGINAYEFFVVYYSDNGPNLFTSQHPSLG